MTKVKSFKKYKHAGLTGFVFKDRYGMACSLQESSLAFESAIWLGVDGEDTRMHLTQEQVRALLPLLLKFVEKGTL